MAFVPGYSKTSANTNRNPSARIWGKLPIFEWANGNGGFFFHDDFLNPNDMSADSDTAGKYASYIDSGCTIKGDPTQIGGVLKMNHDGTDNDETSICSGGNAGVMATIDDAAPQIFAFEARIRKNSIANDGIGFFCGCSEEGMAIADAMVDDTFVLKTTADFIGFRNLADDGAAMDFVYQKASQTLNEVIAGVQTMVADTYYKVGFLYDPFNHPNSKKIKIFVDGLEKSTYVTQALIEAAAFPAGEELALLLATKIGTATANLNLCIDWWRCGGTLP